MVPIWSNGQFLSLDVTIKQQESDDSLVDYGEGGEGQFNVVSWHLSR